jgi:glycosyltransferase involved in cell wall biosynthesis
MECAAGNLTNLSMKASIIVSLYNADNYILDTLESIKSQDYSDIEIIVVDDCSTDNSKQIVLDFRDERVRYVGLPLNHGGPSRPRNIGIKHATGDVIFLCDSDDIMLPGKISSTMAVFTNDPLVTFVHSNFQKIDENGFCFDSDPLSQYHNFKQSISHVSDNLYTLPLEQTLKQLLTANFVGTSSVAMKRSLVEMVGRFDESIDNGDDFDYWLRASELTPFTFIDRPFHQYRIHEGSISFRGAINAWNRIKVLEKTLSRPHTREITKLIKRRICNNYSALSISASKNGQHYLAIKYALKVLSIEKSLRGLVLSLKAPIRFMFCQFNTKT